MLHLFNFKQKTLLYYTNLVTMYTYRQFNDKINAFDNKYMHITCVGTVQLNRQGFQCFNDYKSRETPSTLFYHLKWNERLCAARYIVKTKSNKRNVLVDSSHANPMYKLTKDHSSFHVAVKWHDSNKSQLAYRPVK